MALSAKPYKRGMPMIAKVRRRMRQIKEYIDGHLEKPITVEKIADKFGMSYAAVRGQFRERYGESMGAYIRNRRLELAIAQLRKGKPVAEVMRRYHFETYSGFNKAFSRRFGMTPLEAREGKQTHTQRAAGEKRQAVEQVKAHIDRHFAEPLSVLALAEQYNISPSRLATLFKQAYGLPPKYYLQKLRIDCAAAELRRGASVAEAAAGSGYHNYAGFCTVFSRQFGMTPSEYRMQHAAGKET